VLAFDAHIDTVGITNPSRWRHDPFRGVVAGGTLFGRGASDQKGGLAAVVHGVALASRLGLPEEATVWAVASVNSEDCDGQAWQFIVNETKLRPEVVVIAMPSHLGVCRGQRGRVEIEIDVAGVSTHGSQPERGSNAIYAMCPIITAASRLHGSLERPTRCSQGLARGHRRQLAVAVADRRPRRVHDSHRPPPHDRRKRRAGPGRAAGPARGAGGRGRGPRAALRRGLVAWPVLPDEQGLPGLGDREGSPAVQAAFTTAERVLGRQPRLHAPPSRRTAAPPRACSASDHRLRAADEVHSHTVNDQISLASSSRRWPSTASSRKSTWASAMPRRRRGRWGEKSRSLPRPLPRSLPRPDGDCP